MELEAIHDQLTKAFDLLIALHGECDPVSPDTAFAIGQAAGLISQAKALVGRDIDTARSIGFGCQPAP